MENANSPDYLEKIKLQVIENLKRTAAAPSVQATDIPRTSMMDGLDSDAEDAADDEDQDANPDVRYTQRDWDQKIARDDEFEESEDEEINEQNGVRRQPGQKRRRGIMDFQNPNAVPDFEPQSGMGSRLATPSPGLRSRSRTGSAIGDVTMGDGSREENAAISSAKAERALKAADDSPAPGLAGDADFDDADEADEEDEMDADRDVKDEDGDVDMDGANDEEPRPKTEEPDEPAAEIEPNTAPSASSKAQSKAATPAANQASPAAGSNSISKTTPPASPPTAADPENPPVEPDAEQPGTQATADTTGLPAADVEMAEDEPAVQKEEGLRERQERDEAGEQAKVVEESKED